MRASSGTLFFVLAVVLASAVGAQTFREQGDLLLREGRYDDARKLALSALAANPADTDAGILVARSLLGLGRPADASNYASKSWDQRKDPRLAAIIGEAFFDMGRNDEALIWLRYYLSALPEGPLAASSYYLTGEVYIRLARFGHADAAISTAVYLEPGNAQWWSRLAWAQEKAGDSRQALKSYEAALAIDPRLDDAVIGRERVLARLRG